MSLDFGGSGIEELGEGAIEKGVWSQLERGIAGGYYMVGGEFLGLFRGIVRAVHPRVVKTAFQAYMCIDALTPVVARISH